MSKKAMTKTAWSIDQVRQVLDSGATKVDGMLLDHFSASALVQIYDALSPENQAKLEAMSLDRAMDIVWKLASKTGSRDTEQYVVRGGDNGSYDVLSGPYDSQDEAVNVSAMNDGSSTMSGTQLDSSTIGHDYRMGSAHTATDWDQADFDANAAFWSGRADAERAKEQRRQELYGWKGQEVVVVGGRKIPKGTRGICFYSGAGQYGWRIGFKDASGQEYWTDLKNVELAIGHTASLRTAGYPDSGGYYPRDSDYPDAKVPQAILDEYADVQRRIKQWREGGDEDYLSEMITHRNYLEREYGLSKGSMRTTAGPSNGEYYMADEYYDLTHDSERWDDDDRFSDVPEDDDDDDDGKPYGPGNAPYIFTRESRHAIADEFDLRPLHSRVATAFLQKG